MFFVVLFFYFGEGGGIWLRVGDKNDVLCVPMLEKKKKLEVKNKLTRSRPPQSACNNLVHLSFLSGCLNTILKINLARPSALVTVTFGAAAAASPCCPPALFTLSGAKDDFCPKEKKKKMEKKRRTKSLKAMLKLL